MPVRHLPAKGKSEAGPEAQQPEADADAGACSQEMEQPGLGFGIWRARLWRKPARPSSKMLTQPRRRYFPRRRRARDFAPRSADRTIEIHVGLMGSPEYDGDRPIKPPTHRDLLL